MTLAISIDDVRDAHERIRGLIHLTPVLTCSTLDRLTGLSLHFKAEVFQKSGSFKIRGAANAVFSLTAEECAKGVVTHSSGNHAGAVALAAKLRGIPAHIVVPSNTPSVKTSAVEAYGGKLYFCDPTIDAREAECARLQKETGAAFVHPYNDPRVMAEISIKSVLKWPGQGTIALELLEQVPNLDAIIVPVSGGGMISGIAVAAKSLKPSIQIWAAEPTGINNAADVAAAKASGELVKTDRPCTIADGLQGRLGTNTWPVVKELVDGVITVGEEAIVGAMRLIYLHAKVVVEASGAVGLAAALKASKEEADGCGLRGCKAVGIVLCGGNVDLDAKGLWDMTNWQPGV